MRINYRALLWSIGLSLPVITISSLLILQQHESSRRWMAQYLSEIIQDAFDCQFSMRIEELHVFPLTLVCSNVSARPSRSINGAHDWNWRCGTISFHCSWLSLLLLRSLKTNIAIDHLTAQTTVDQDRIAIFDHIKKLFLSKKGRIPLIIKTLTVQHAIVELDCPGKELHTVIEGSVSSKKINNNFHTNVQCSRGVCTFQGKPIITLEMGNFESTAASNGQHRSEIAAAFNVLPLPAATGTCHVVGTLENNTATYGISNNDQTMDIQATTNLISHETMAHGSVSSALIKPFIVDNNIIKNYQDTLNFQATLDTQSMSTRGTCSLQHIPLSCSWHMQKDQYQLQINNNAALQHPSLPAWKIEPNKLSIEITKTAHGNNQGTINAEILNTTHHTIIPCRVIGTGNVKNFSAQGHCGSYPLSLSGSIVPTVVIKEAMLGATQKPLLHLHAQCDQTSSFSGTIDYAQALNVLDDSIARLAPGTGTIHLNGIITPQKITCNMSLCSANIVIKKIFNLLTHAQCTLSADWENRCAIINNLSCTFQRGTLTSQQITGRLSDTQNSFFIHAPISFQECLIKWDQALTLISGGLTLTYHSQAPSTLEGLIIIDKAHIDNAANTQTIFSNKSPKKQLFPIPLDLDIHIVSKKAIRICTPELHTKACPALTLRGPTNNLRLHGTVNLRGGAITFPYRSLKIVRGALYATPEHSLDPLIDLQAKSQIDQHTVNLLLTGSLEHPIIHLQSTPPLSEEQIAGLLITGSSEQLLNAAAPGFVLDNIAHYIAGNIAKMSQSNQLLANLIKPLKHIHVTPLINEQSGQQNIGGAVEIDLGKRLKAKVQKNLTFDDDAALEIDYHLSDEVSVKAFKNEQGDLGSLLQMRLKF